MKKIIFIAALSLIGFASCNKDIVKEVNTGKAIDFRVALDTKGTEVTTGNLNHFYVTALTETGAVYFKDEAFFKSGDIFESQAQYYWPAEEDLNFYAYSPRYNSLGETLPITINSQTKSISGYCPAADISDQIDIVIAKATGNKEENETSGVYLGFYHQLAQVEVRAKNENRGFVYKVKGMKIMNVASKGDLNFSVTSSWTPDYDSMTDYAVEFDQELTLGEDAQSMMPSANDNAMLIPQTTRAWDVENDAEANADGGSYLAIYIQATTTDGSRVFPSTGEYGWIAYPIAFDWESGYKYIYTLNFTEGAGYVDPENTPDDPDNPYKPGEEVLGGTMTFETTVNSWNNYYLPTGNM